MWFRGHRQHAGALPFDVESERLDVGLHAVEVLHAHRLEGVNLVGPACLSVLQSVCQAGVDEAAVAARRGPADPVGVDEHDAAIRISLCGMQCGPQPGVAPTDNQQVAGERSGCLRVFRPRNVEPHRAEGACRKRTFDQAGIDVGIKHRLHIADTTGWPRIVAQISPGGHRFSAGAGEPGQHGVDLCANFRRFVNIKSTIGRRPSRRSEDEAEPVAPPRRGRTSRAIATYSWVCSFQMLKVSTCLVRP